MSPTKEIYKLFLALLLLCHLVAVLAVSGLSVTAYLGLCLLWREVFYGERYLFVDSQRDSHKWQRRIYFIFGLTSSDEEVERLEARELSEIATKRRIVTALGFALITGLYFQIARRQGLPPPSVTFFLGFTGFVLAFASHLRQLFFGLALSAAPVLMQAWSDGLEKPWITAYVVTLFLALMTYRFLDASAQTGKAITSQRLPATRTLGVATLFLSLLVVFDFLLPNPEPPKPATPLSEKVASHIAEKIVERQIRNGDSGGRAGESGGAPFGSNMQKAGGKQSFSQSGFDGQLPPLGSGHKNPPAGRTFSPEDLEKLRELRSHSGYGPDDLPQPSRLKDVDPNQLDKLSEELQKRVAERQPPTPVPQAAETPAPGANDRTAQDSAPAAGAAGTPGSTEELRKFLEKISKTKPSGQTQEPITRETLEKFRQAHPEEKALRALEQLKNLKPEEIKKLADEFENFQKSQSVKKQGKGELASPGGSPGSHGTNAGSPPTSAHGSPAPTAASSSPASTPVTNPEQKKKDLTKELAVWIRFAGQMAKIALAIGLVLLAFLFFARTRKKPDEKRVRNVYLSRDTRRRLREILAEIKTRRLSASEEIIETYNAILMIFSESHFPRGEDTPVSLFADSVRLALPPLGPPMQNATECFEQTLYGEKSATQERLQAFRESSRAIVRYFNI